jgi:type IV pilus assembly protein PilW
LPELLTMKTNQFSAAASMRATGFSIIELMVSIAVGMLLLTGIANIFASSSRSQREVALSAEQIENGRYAIDTLTEDLHHAGFWGLYAPAATAPGAMPDPCALNAAALSAAMALPVQGYNAPVAALPSCLSSADYLAGTDILVVRHASTSISATLSPNGRYVQTAPGGTPIVADGGGTFSLMARNGTGASVPAPIRAYGVHIYFVSPCSVAASGSCTASDDGGRPIPTLKRLELSVDPSDGVLKMMTTPIAEGIENLQVYYGLDADGDGSPDQGAYSDDPGAVATWMQAVTAQVYVLARNRQTSPGYTDTKSYVLGPSVTVSPGGSYRRHVYASLMRLKNPSERLETP